MINAANKYVLIKATSWTFPAPWRADVSSQDGAGKLSAFGKAECQTNGTRTTKQSGHRTHTSIAPVCLHVVQGRAAQGVGRPLKTSNNCHFRCNARGDQVRNHADRLYRNFRVGPVQDSATTISEGSGFICFVSASRVYNGLPRSASRRMVFRLPWEIALTRKMSCPRCRHALWKMRQHPFRFVIACGIAALLFYALVLTAPFLSLTAYGQLQIVAIATGPFQLVAHGL